MKPKSLNLFGQKWKVTYLEPYTWLDHQFRGRTNYEKREITVLLDYQERSTLLHELLHVASDTLHGDMTEQQVERLEKGLYMIFEANPKLLDYLKGEVNERSRTGSGSMEGLESASQRRASNGAGNQGYAEEVPIRNEEVRETN